MRKCPGLCLLLLLFVLVVAFVDPVREMMTGGDGWAYALSVRHWLRPVNTGLVTGRLKKTDTHSHNARSFCVAFGSKIIAEFACLLKAMCRQSQRSDSISDF
jgi:hypothetical protein